MRLKILLKTQAAEVTNVITGCHLIQMQNRAVIEGSLYRDIFKAGEHAKMDLKPARSHKKD